MSPSNYRLIADAFDDYAKQVGLDLTKNPLADALRGCNSPNAVLELLQDKSDGFKNYRDGGHTLMNWLKPVVQVVHGFSGVLGPAISLVPFPPASAIFASVDFLLSAAVGVSSSYDSLVDLFECLGNFLKRLEIYTTIPFTPLMTDIIVKILVELLSVLALATKQVQQGRLKKFAKKLLGEGEIEAVLQKLDRLTQEEARMMAAQTLEVVHCLVNNVKVVMDDGKASLDGIRNVLVTMQGIAGEINKMKRDQMQKDARKWISPPDPSKNYNIACDTYQSGTGLWFFQGGVFSEWRAKGALLWIHGKPGSGKTLLLSSIIRDIDRLCATGLALMAYYYFDFRDTDKQHRRGLLSSLLCQLCAESDPCYEILSHLYTSHGVGTREPSEGALTQCLMDMLQLEGQPAIYIIVDALDECPNATGMPTPREKVLEFLEDLIDSQVPNVHICVTSRPEFDIRSVLEPLTPFRVSLHDESGQKKDILDYVSTVVNSDRRMRKWRAQEKQLVIDTLSERADGMFRWVFCQLETLRHSFPSGLRHTLDMLPETLDETYEQILLGIEKAKRKSAYRLLQCLAVAIRPLRVDELAEVLALRFDPGQDSEYRTDWRPEDSHEAVLSACSSLITVVDVDGSQVVQFSHFSVKEFLTSDRLASAGLDLSGYHIVPQHSHTLLAQACINILLQLDDSVDKDSIKNSPLAVYAAQYWVDHIKSGNVSSGILDDMVRLFDRDKPHFSTWVWLYDMDHPGKGILSSARPTKPATTPLYYAVLCGFRDLAERLLSIHPEDVSVGDGYYGTSLHTALSRGHIDIAILLLQHAADINAIDDEGSSPLHSASESGRRDIVQLLLDHHANINLQNTNKETPLWLASSNGELEVTRLLLQNGPDVELRDGEGRSVMNIASENGHPEIIQLLLESGVPVDTRDNDGWTALDAAARNGYPDVVRLLLDHGADVNSQDDEGWTPLYGASEFDFLEVVKQLLDHRANVSLRDNKGQTPLHKSLKDDRLGIVRAFLEHGTEVDILNGRFRTPLAVASGDGQVEVSRFLIGQGANVHSSDDEGWTPLHLASQHGHLDVVRLLLDSGTDVNSPKVNFATPLHLASANDHVKVAELLVERGADINKQTDSEETPLHRASANGRLEVAPFLLKWGSDVNSRDSEGRTPLHAAAREGHLDVVKFLLESGADIDARSSKDESPLYLAAGNGKHEVASFLAERMGVALPEIVTAPQSAPTEVVDAPSESGDSESDDESSTSDSDDEGDTTIHGASKGGHLDAVRKFLEDGADVDSRNDDYDTPLQVASNKGRLEVARLLIDRGATVNCRNEDGWTPLHDAAWEEHLDVVRLLLDNGADVDALNHYKWTPLHIAASNGYTEIVDLLLERGANANAVNDDGRTPAREAMASGYRAIARMLTNHGAGASGK